VPDDVSPLPDMLRHAPAVDAAVGAELGRLADDLRDVDPGLAPAAEALVDAAQGGKRLRGALVCWSYAAHAGPDARAEDVLGAAVAVELVHLSALVHDDIIDRSATRRGRPSTHARFAAAHAASGASAQAAAEHGRNVAILLGDVLLAAAPEPLRRCRVRPDVLDRAQAALVRLQIEVMAGQFLDVDAAARRVGDPDRALTIATLKSGRYSVSRPLELGALLAGADADVAARLLEVGDPLGVAFQLRDDLLGVFGDPAVTGKPAGSDLIEGKRTLLVAETLARLGRDAGRDAGRSEDPQARDAFETALGGADLDHAAVAALTTTIERCGARGAVETHVTRCASQAVDAIGRLPLRDEDRQALRDLAIWMTTRHR
jgi:geranylgeranyl diphosphate synthase type I